MRGLRRTGGPAGSRRNGKKYRHLPGRETWKRRKEESQQVLREASDHPGTQIIWLADKPASMRLFYRLWQREGTAMWTGFRQSDPVERAWYFRCVASLPADLKDTDAWQEYPHLIDRIIGGTDNGSQLSSEK